MIEHSKKRLLGILDALPFAAFIIDEDHKILHWNKLLESLTGLKAEEMLGTKQHWKAFYKSVRPCLADLLVDSKVDKIQKFYTGKYAKSDLLDDAYEITDFFSELGDKGKWLRFTAAVIRDSLGAIVCAVETLEDITEHKQADEKLHLLIKLTQGIIKTSDFHSAIEFVLRSVCEATNWVYGEAWIPGDNGAALECLPVWYSHSPDKMKKFRKVSEEIRFPANTGLPGRVWSSRLHEWIPDISITSDKISLRTKVAAKTGLKAAIGVPIIAGENFLGVLVFFDFKTYQEDNHQVELVSAVAAQLGEVIQRKHAHDALIESEARLKKAEHVAQLGYWELDLVKDTLLWSEEVFRIFDLKPQEFRATYEAFLDNIHPDDRQFVNKAYTDSLKDRTTYDIVHRLMLKDGTLKYVNEQCETIFDENGTPLRSLGTIQDITEIKQAEERINHLNLVLQAIHNVNQLIIKEKTPDVLIQKVCDTLTETRGYSTAWIMLLDERGEYLDSAESDLGKGFTPLLKELKRGDFPACVQQALRQPSPAEITDPSSTCAECPITEKYSDKVCMTIRLEHAEKIYGILSVSFGVDFAVDEEELSLFEEVAGDVAFALYSIKTEQERDEGEAELILKNLVFDESISANSIADNQGVLTYVNKAFLDIWGYSNREEVLGKPISDLLSFDDEANKMVSALNETGTWKGEYTALKKDKTTFDAYGLATIIKDKSGNILGYQSAVQDISQQKLVLQDLRISEERLLNAQQLGHLGFTEWDLKTNQVILSDETYKIYGFKLQEGLATHELLMKAVHPDDREFVQKSIDSLIKNGEKLNIDHRIIHPDGEIRWVNKQTEITYDVDGNPETIHGIILDITDRKLAELALVQSEEKYRSVVEDSPGLISRFTPDGTITFVNQASCSFFGKKYHELIGMNITSTMPEENRENVISTIASLSPESPIRISENENIRHDGEIHWIRWTDRALFDNEGQIINIQAFGEDITESKQANQKLHRSEENLRAVLDASQDIIHLVDINGIILDSNKAFAKITGIELEDIIGTSVFDYGPPKSQTKRKAAIEQVFRTGELLELETKGIDNRIYDTYLQPVFIIDEGVKAVSIYARDITERVRAEQLLNALNQAVVAMGATLTQQEIFNAVAEELKQINISCMLFPLDETQSKLITKYMSYESSLLSAVEKLMGIKFQDFSFPIEAVDLFQEVVREKNTLITDNPEQALQQTFPKINKKIFAQIIKTLRIQRNIFAPLIVEDQVIGLFSVQSDNLTQEDTPIITAFADQLSSAWNKIGLLQNLRKTVEGTIHTIAATVEARDPYTAGHQQRVADLATAIAKEMKLTDEQIEGVKMAGLIHDLGKIQVPAEILSKPGKLTELEFGLVKIHPQVGFDLLKEIEFPWPIAQMVRQHHEKMDGSGYPQGLKGDEILLEARILAVADIVEAMSSHRPYRPALGIEKALTQIKKDKGTLLDPDVVDACLKVFEDGYKLPKG